MRISDWSSDVCSSDLTRHFGQQCLGVGVVGSVEDILGDGDLHHAAEIHDDHAVGDVLDHREVVADEEIGEVEVLAQVHEKVDDLGLDRDVQRSDGLVADQEARLHRQCAGNRSEEHTSELQSLMRISYAGFCLKKKKQHK